MNTPTLPELFAELKTILVKAHPEDSRWEPSISHLVGKIERALAALSSALPQPDSGHQAERSADTPAGTPEPSGPVEDINDIRDVRDTFGGLTDCETGGSAS